MAGKREFDGKQQPAIRLEAKLGQAIKIPAAALLKAAQGKRTKARKPKLRIGKVEPVMATKVEIKRIETPGLMVREMVASDARCFANYMLRPDFQETIAIRYESAADVQKFVARCLRRQMAQNRSVFHLSAVLKASDHVVGDGFVVMNRPKTVEVGWGVHPDLWGRGFGTEIGRALLSVAFERLGATTVWAKSFVSNTASLRVMEKLGMSEDRIAKDHPVAQGFRTDVAFHSITADQYFDTPY